MTPLTWAIRPFRKYAVFTGRSGRSEFWWFVLLVTVLAFLVELAATLAFGPNSVMSGLVTLVIDLAVFLPSTSVTIRRLHDIGYSGWWILVGVVPLFGTSWLIFRMARKSQVGSNRFGPNPQVEATANGLLSVG